MKPRGAAVAQIFNLLYRGFATRFWSFVNLRENGMNAV